MLHQNAAQLLCVSNIPFSMSCPDICNRSKREYHREIYSHSHLTLNSFFANLCIYSNFTYKHNVFILLLHIHTWKHLFQISLLFSCDTHTIRHMHTLVAIKESATAEKPFSHGMIRFVRCRLILFHFNIYCSIRHRSVKTWIQLSSCVTSILC